MSAIVIGGGISGLSASFYLSRLTKDGVRLLEAAPRMGGWIQSVKNENGTTFELGPRTMRIVGHAGANTLQLVEELKLSDMVRPVLNTSAAARTRMLYVNGQLHPLPNSFKSFFKRMPPFSRPFASVLLTDLTTPAVRLEDDSIYNFVARRMGQEIADYAVSALVCGVCAGDAKKISVNLLMKAVFDGEQKYGGIVRGFFGGLLNQSEVRIFPQSQLHKVAKAWSVWSLTDGLETLPRALAADLNTDPNVSVETNARCEKLEFPPEGVKVSVNGRTEYAPHVYCSLPSRQLAKILPQEHSKLAEELAGIPFVTVAVVNLEYRGNVLPVDGFGFLVPPSQNLDLLGVIFDTCCFPQGDSTVLTAMMGGEWFGEKFGTSPEESHLATIAEQEIRRILKIKEKPINVKVSILRSCIPQYIVGHNARVQRIRDYITAHNLPITLIGSSYDGIGVNDVIYASRNAVERNLSEFK